MRLDELIKELHYALVLHDAVPEYGVIVCVDGDDLGIDSVDLMDGVLRIHVESK